MQNKQFSVFILLISSIFVSICCGLPARICNGTEMVEFIPHPTACSLYIMCLLGVPNVLECQHLHIYNPATKRCEPGNPLTCELFTTPGTASTATITETQSTHEPKEPESTTLSEYDSTIEIDYTIIQETTDEISTTLSLHTTTTPGTPIHRCPPGGTGYIPHHTNCSRYFECIKGIRHLRFCPDGFLFDSITLECTLPELAVCAAVI